MLVDVIIVVVFFGGMYLGWKKYCKWYNIK